MAKKISLKHFLKAVASAGTQEALSASTIWAKTIMIQAESSNTGIIYIGDSSVSSSDYAVELAAGNSVSIEAPPIGPGQVEELDLADIYIDASVSTDGVSVGYLISDS